MPSDKYERECWSKNHFLLGCDEAGYGPLAGSMFVAGVVFPRGYDFTALCGLNDSKEIPEEARFTLEPLIKQDALKWFVVEATAAEIDAGNVYWLRFTKPRDYIQEHRADFPQHFITYMDGNRALEVADVENHCLVKGDSHIYTVAAASILAKTAKDRQMLELDREFPLYDWAQNKGYGTVKHRAAVSRFGMTPHHRKSYCKNIQIQGGS